MSRVVVLSTGGTIATHRGLAHDGADALLARLPVDPGVRVEGADVFRLGSFVLTARDMWTVATRTREALADADVAGVVVTHGTDSMEETAFLTDLFHTDPRPVVFTGAQRPADAADSDGPRNLADAVTVAAGPAARGLGVLIAFGGRIFPARGTGKAHTLAPAAFHTPDAGPIGSVRGGSVDLTATPVRHPALDPGMCDLAGVRVDIVACYPGTDTVALDAVAAAGAGGVVLEATGAGNANPAVRDAVSRLTEAGVVVALSTRVPAGPVTPMYRGGGGIELVEAGAVPTGTLRPPQTRILLTALLGCYRDPSRVSRELRVRSSTTGRG